MATVNYRGDQLWGRMERAVEKVRERLDRAATALRDAGIPYAVSGGNAVAAWVAQVDEAAVRNTRDVDLLIRREDLTAARTALETAGFVYRRAAGVDMFLDGPGAKARDAVHVVFAGENDRHDYVLPAPGVEETTDFGGFQVLSLEALVRMKLTSFRRKDQVHLLDLIDVGLVDETWPDRFPPKCKARLQELLENPES